MIESDRCVCSTAPKLIFTCPGAADIGAIVYQAELVAEKSGGVPGMEALV